MGSGAGSGWAGMRPVLVAFLLVADAFVVGALAIAHPRGWVAPLIAFGVVLVGLVWFEVWAVRRRHDDEA
jgi:hypothetical protein